jgi:hypothetical protein
MQRNRITMPVSRIESENIETSTLCMDRKRQELLPYIQSEIGQLATARFLDVGWQLILPPQCRSFVDELAFLVVTRARLTQLLAPRASWMSFVTLQQHSQHSGYSSYRHSRMHTLTRRSRHLSQALSVVVPVASSAIGGDGANQPSFVR